MAELTEVTQQAIDYSQRIPNNVDLSTDRALQRALERWQPAFLNWWKDTGPADSAALQVYLRTAVSVDRDGWANFEYVRMPEYRWGIFLTPRDESRKINFGDHCGQPAWQEVPGEYRSTLRRIIVTQGDTEPASVEQQKLLGATCPSLYDLRNLFQVNVEEGRHLWAMVYLLHRYFGRDGREEAEALLARRSGDPNNPRILTAFNEKTSNWLAFYMFTFFTDRDGKFQLAALSESGFDPLARTTKFMLTEEAHHMFVGPGNAACCSGRFFSVAFLRAALCLPPFVRLRDYLARRAARHPIRQDIPVAHLVWAVRTTAAYIPRATCLTQALAAKYQLERSGHCARIHIGVAKENGQFRAHAWLECEGEIVLGGAVADRYARLLAVD